VALQKMDKILNNIPSTVQSIPLTKPKRVTFDKIPKPPREILSPIKVLNDVHPAPRVPNEMPTPRVISPLPTIAKAIIDKPIHNEAIDSKVYKARKEPLFE
jgi:hypothetical protein